MARPIIAIDVGHNVKMDVGASGTVDGITAKEDEIVMAVGKDLQSICQAAGMRTVWCLPESAVSAKDSLRQRVMASNKAGATIFLSLHCNVFKPTDSPMGVEAYALSIPARALAEEIVNRLSAFGWKNRGVKRRPFYALRNTSAVAVLVEICFLDSAFDRAILAKVAPAEIAQAIYEAVLEGAEPPDDTPPDDAPPDIVTVEESILAQPGSTSGVDGLDSQVIQRMGLDSLAKVFEPNFTAGDDCIPYFQPHVAASLSKILRANSRRRMTCTSAFRSVVRQCVLYECFRRRIGGITLAATPGSNAPHSQAIAIDIQEWENWKPILEDEGWDWQGSAKRRHFDLHSKIPDLPSRSIKAFQELWNENNPDKLVVDGIWGEKTRQAMLRSPAEGWREQPQVAFRRSLKMGASGLDVVRVWQRLRELKYYEGAIEHNRFEQPLRDALIEFQRMVGLPADGIAGRSTLAALFPGKSEFEQLIKGA